MTHQEHCGWGRFPLSKMTTISRTCRCRKCTNIAVLVVAHSGQPSTGQIYGPPMVGKAIGTSAVPHPGTSLPNSVSCLPLAHVVSPCAPPSKQVPYPPRTPYTELVPSDTPVRKVPLLSSVARTPPPTGSLPLDMGGKPFWLSSRHWYTGPPYLTGQLRC